MAIYHFHISVVKRSLGHSSIAAAAYCSATKLIDERTGLTHDFTNKHGVVYSDILLPTNAPSWLKDRSILWNLVERSERRKDGQLARILDIALPKELSIEKNWLLAKDFVNKTFVAQGMIADLHFHNDNSKNPHIHVMLTMRRVDLTVTDYNTPKIFTNKVRDWNKTNVLLSWRKSWAEICNCYLGQHQISTRIDHRSHADRGIKDLPTIHMGRAYFAFKYRKKILKRVKFNQSILSHNLYIKKNLNQRTIDEKLSRLRVGCDGENLCSFIEQKCRNDSDYSFSIFGLSRKKVVKLLMSLSYTSDVRHKIAMVIKKILLTEEYGREFYITDDWRLLREKYTESKKNVCEKLVIVQTLKKLLDKQPSIDLQMTHLSNSLQELEYAYSVMDTIEKSFEKYFTSRAAYIAYVQHGLGKHLWLDYQSLMICAFHLNMKIVVWEVDTKYPEQLKIRECVGNITEPTKVVHVLYSDGYHGADFSLLEPVIVKNNALSKNVRIITYEKVDNPANLLATQWIKRQAQHSSQTIRPQSISVLPEVSTKQPFHVVVQQHIRQSLPLLLNQVDCVITITFNTNTNMSYSTDFQRQMLNEVLMCLNKSKLNETETIDACMKSYRLEGDSLSVTMLNIEQATTLANLITASGLVKTKIVGAEKKRFENRN